MTCSLKDNSCNLETHKLNKIYKTKFFSCNDFDKHKLELNNMITIKICEKLDIDKIGRAHV